MNLYKTLNGEVFDLNKLTKREREIYSEVKAFYNLNTDWTEFSNLWITKIREAFSSTNPSLVTKKNIYRICQDLESRLGVRQGYTREIDYRDLLADIINIHFKSRYQFCNKLAFDQGYLSSVLNRKKHISMNKLQEALDKINYRIAFVEKGREVEV